jgi:hypothetical protein
MVNLGDKVRDRINGFTGIVTGRSVYLYGCVHVLVAPTALPADGKHPDSTWIDEDRVEIIEAAAAAQPQSAAVRAGGPSVNPLPPLR